MAPWTLGSRRWMVEISRDRYVSELTYVDGCTWLELSDYEVVFTCLQVQEALRFLNFGNDSREVKMRKSKRLVRLPGQRGWQIS